MIRFKSITDVSFAYITSARICKPLLCFPDIMFNIVVQYICAHMQCMYTVLAYMSTNERRKIVFQTCYSKENTVSPNFKNIGSGGHYLYLQLQISFLCTSLAASRSGKQVFVSCQLPPDNVLLPEVEKRIIQEMKENPDVF